MTPSKLRRWLALIALVFAGVGAAPLRADEPTVYNPLAITPIPDGKPLDLTITDAARKRDIPIRVYLPQKTKPAPLILFSHGLGGSRQNSPYLGKHWSARGYVVVFLQHPGSDEAVWKEAKVAERMAAMREAASGPNFMLRVKDVAAVLDQLEKWSRADDHQLAGRLDLQHVGMCGHSFGAVTTQAVSGQTMGRGLISLTDKRIKAAIAFSPSSPRRGDPQQAFSKVSLPWLLMTGTNDVSVIGDQTVESRLAVYPALPPGGKYELVLDKGEHSAFSDRALPGDKEQRNPNHHRAILAISTAFWDAYLREDEAAKKWLDGDGPRGVLEKEDRWQRK
jgi:predicted dienelactone hydrolase